MKLGLLTAAFPQLTLVEAAEWSAANGCEMMEIAGWPNASGERRHHAGVYHIGESGVRADGRAREAEPSHRA